MLQSPYADSHEFLITIPTATSWPTDRTVLCLLQSTNGKTTFLADLSAVKVDPRKKTWSGLRPGDCLKLTEKATVLVQTLPCDRPHTDQIVTSFSLPKGPWPGTKKVEKTIDVRCTELLDAFFDKHPPTALIRYSSVYPTRSDWAGALCLVSNQEDTFLYSSLVP